MTKTRGNPRVFQRGWTLQIIVAAIKVRDLSCTKIAVIGQSVMSRIGATVHGQSETPDAGHLWVETPLVYSKHRSSALDADVYLKLEVSGSFCYPALVSSLLTG